MVYLWRLELKGFNEVEGNLYVDNVRLSEIAEKYGTPTYVYSASKFKQNFDSYFSSLRPEDKICYSVKSNSNSHILSMLSRLGSGYDVVSGNELRKCLNSGADPKNIVFSGVGKTEKEIKLALEKGIFSINIESEEELDRIIEISKERGSSADCFIRVNPDISADTHPYVQTGLKTSKFGVTKENIESMAKKTTKSGVVNLIGIASHIGSQISNKDLILESLHLIIQITEQLRNQGHNITHLDLGGGLGIRYKEEKEISPKEVLTEVLSILDPLDISLIVEPGRSISGNAGVLLSKVEYLKKTDNLNFAVIDSGMNDMMRPSLYQAWHNISVVDNNQEKNLPYKIVGPVCESSDTFGEDRLLSLGTNSLVVIHDVGAYGHVMASNYNGRLRPSEILVEGENIKLIRRRETFEDLMIQEKDV